MQHNAAWEIGTLYRRSWTGKDIKYDPFHLAWKIEEDHPLTAACNQAYSDVFGGEPREYEYWDFGTNAVTPVSMDIPTIGFSPGEAELAHVLNESCEVSKIIEAYKFYAALINKI